MAERPPVLVALLPALAATAALVAVFWVLRDFPGMGSCYGISPAEHQAINDYRLGAVRLHFLAGLLLSVSIAWLSSVHRQSHGRGGRPGIPTIGALLLVAAAYVGNVFDGNVLAAAGFLQLFFGFILLPGALLVLITVVVLSYRRGSRAGLTAAIGCAWVLLVIVVPAHYSLIAWLDQPLCLD